MHTAFIFESFGREKEEKKLFNECLNSSFELGPLNMLKIKKAMK